MAIARQGDANPTDGDPPPGLHRDGPGVAELLELAHDRTPAGRAALATAIGDLFYGAERPLGLAERALVSEILRRLIGEVEATVRRALAARLAERDDAPFDVVWTLANDEADIAYPILARSSLLHDEELIAIVRERSTRHRLAVATRAEVSPAVSDALLVKREEAVAATLLANARARLSDGAYAIVAEMAETHASLHAPLLRRADLPLDVARRVYWWVSAALRQHIVKRFEIDPRTLDDAIEDTVEGLAPWHRRADIAPPPDIADAAERLIRAEAVTPETLTHLMRTSQIDLFEVLLARSLGLRLVALRRILYEPGGVALAVALKAIGTSKSDFASIFIWSRQARPGDQSVDPGEVSRTLAFYENIRPQAALSVLRRWQRDPDYVAALRALETEGAA